MIRIVDIREKGELCKHINNRECSFGGAASCKGTGWYNPEECTLYQLKEGYEILKEKVRELELKVNGVSTATTSTFRQ